LLFHRLVNRLRTWLFLFFHTTKLPSQAVVRNFSLAYCMVTAKFWLIRPPLSTAGAFFGPSPCPGLNGSGNDEQWGRNFYRFYLPVTKQFATNSPNHSFSRKRNGQNS
jgi:hypothetical protein